MNKVSSAHSPYAVVPNGLSLARIVLIVPILFLLWDPQTGLQFWAGVGFFACAAATDFLDGVLARRYGWRSNFGEFLDPLADKLLAISLLVMLIAQNRIGGTLGEIAGLTIILREVAITGLRDALSRRGVSMPASLLARAKTNMQFLAILFLILAMFYRAPFYQMGLLFLALAVIATLVSGAGYVWRGARLVVRAKNQ